MTEDQMLELSDEDFLKLDPSSFPETSGTETQTQTASGETDGGNGEGSEPVDDGEEAGGKGAQATAATEADETADAGTADSPAPVEGKETPADSTPVTETKEEAQDTGTDLKGFYDRITAPFRANGKDMQVSSPEDVVALMQMGANYSKKMEALKPALKIVKLLENHQLLDETKLSFLIDLSKKDPGAIQKLVKDSGMDPLDMDVSKESEYSPKPYVVDDRELMLDAVLDKIQHSPHYSRVLDTVSKQWDKASKQIIANHPQILEVIESHMAGGLYDTIQGEVERERMLGRLSGLSDLEAYRQVGDAINARGGFTHQAGGTGSTPTERSSAPAPSSNVTDAEARNRKRAASPTTSTPASTPSTVNPLAMSDDEFLKSLNQKFA